MSELIHEVYEEIPLGGGPISPERFARLRGHLEERRDNAKMALRLAGYRVTVLEEVYEDDGNSLDASVLRLHCRYQCNEDWSEANALEATGWCLAVPVDGTGAVVIQYPPGDWHRLPREARRAALGLVSHTTDHALQTAAVPTPGILP